MFHLREVILSLAAAFCLGVFPQSLQAVSPVLHAGGTYDPFLLALQPAVRMGALPPWIEGIARVDAATSTVEVSILPAWQTAAVDLFVATVVFQDDGDGGPALEWKSIDGTLTTISYGLGEIGNSVGLNSRTVLLPEVLTRDGGTLLLSYFGKFESLLSLAVRPAREQSLAVIGDRHSPALIDGGTRVMEDREINGTRPVPLSGDVRNGSIIEAEISAKVEPLDSPLEFVIPVAGRAEAGMLRLEALGLDPEARIEVSFNGEPLGSVNFPPFPLDDPALVGDWNGSLILAGWRNGSLFIPARHIREGENSIVLTLNRSPVETGREVFLRNSGIHLRFPAPPPSSFETVPPVETEIDGVSAKPDFLLEEPALTGSSQSTPVAP